MSGHMTVGELRERLKGVPDNTPVLLQLLDVGLIGAEYCFTAKVQAIKGEDGAFDLAPRHPLLGWEAFLIL